MIRNWIVNTLAILALAYFLPGVGVENLLSGAIAAIVLGLLNSILRPVLLFLTLPLSIITLGLFVLVVNTAMVLLADYFVQGFRVDSYIWAFLFSVGMSIIVSIFDKKKD